MIRQQLSEYFTVQIDIMRKLFLVFSPLQELLLTEGCNSHIVQGDRGACHFRSHMVGTCLDCILYLSPFFTSVVDLVHVVG